MENPENREEKALVLYELVAELSVNQGPLLN